MQHPTDLVDMGYVANAFGIQGWVKIKTTTEHPDSLNDYPEVYLKLKDGSVVAKKIVKSFAEAGVFHAKLTGVDDRDAAFALRGAVVAVDRALFPKPAEDEYYWVDLIGLDVINLQGEALGRVSELVETGANDVLVVKHSEGERLLPFVAQYIIRVDLTQKQIVADWGVDY